MRSVATRVAVLFAGGLVMGLALLLNLQVASIGVAAGPLGTLIGQAPTSAVDPFATPAPSLVPGPPPSPTIRPLPSATPAPTLGPHVPPVLSTPPPPPRSEAKGCPHPPADGKLAPVLSHGDPEAMVVALTFDDGFDVANTRRILGILKRYHVNATFFPTGRAVVQSPQVWRDISAAGFPIGDHTYNHPIMSDLCYAAQLAELNRQARAVRSAVGIPVEPYMRPPYEAWNRTTRIATAAAGQHAVVIWSIDTKDWTGETVATITRRALHGGQGAIVLMHTTADNTAIALPDIIRGYRARGFRFVTIGQMLGLEGPVPYP